MNTEGSTESSEPTFFDSVDDAFAYSESTADDELTGEPEGDDELPEAAQAEPDPEVEAEEAEPKQEPKEEEDDQAEDKKKEDEEPEEKGKAEDSFLVIKVDGVEHKLTQEQTKILAQKGFSADAKYQEASQARKQTETLIKTLKEDPVAVLEHPHIGLNFRDIAERYLFDVYDFESKPPEEQERIKEQREKDKKLERYEADEKKRKEAEEKQKLENATKFYQQKFKAELDKEIEASGIPDTMWAFQRSIHYLKQAHAKGIKPEARDVMELVKQDYGEFRTRSVQNMTPEQMIAFLGDENISKIKKHQLEQRKTQVPPSVKPQTATSIRRGKDGKFTGYQSSTNEIFG